MFRNGDPRVFVALAPRPGANGFDPSGIGKASAHLQSLKALPRPMSLTAFCFDVRSWAFDVHISRLARQHDHVINPVMKEVARIRDSGSLFTVITDWLCNTAVL